MKKRLAKMAVMTLVVCLLAAGMAVNALAAETVSLDEALKDASNWDTYLDAPVTSENGWLTITEASQIAAYKEDNYFNKLVEFTFKADADAAGSWPTFCVRDQLGAEKPHWEGGSAYTVTFKGEAEAGKNDENHKGGKIELNAYKAGSWFALGEVVPNEYYWGEDAGGEHKIQFGAIDEGDAVRLILKIDGKEVFNYLDSENPIKEKGNITFYAWAAPISAGPAGAAAAADASNPDTGYAGILPFAAAAAAGILGMFASRRRK